MPGPPSEAVRSQLGVVGIEVNSSSPHGEFQTFAQGRGEGVARGAAEGATQGLLEALAQGARSGGGGPYAVAATSIAALLLTIVGGVTGGAIGAYQAVPADVARDIQEQVDRVLRDLNLAQRLADQIILDSMDRPDLAQHMLLHLDSRTEGRNDVDSIVTIEVTESGFQGGRSANPEVSLYAIARITVSRSADGSLRYQRDFRYDSAPRPYRTWFEDGSRLLADAFQRAVVNLAERILDELFLITDFPFPSGYWAFPGTPEFGVCWFRPLYPEYRQRSMSDSIGEGMRHPITGAEVMARNLILYTPVDSLRPTLRWEPFPRPRDMKPGNEDLLQRIDDVSYDLKVWDTRSGYPRRLVYEQEGLPQPEHTLTYALASHMRYYWTFRARYRLDGRPQVTRWAFSLSPATANSMPLGGTCELDEIPPTNYFRFVTP